MTLINHGHAQGVADSQSIRGAARGREIAAVEELVLREPHHRVVRGGAPQQRLELIIRVEREILVLEARKIRTELRGVCGSWPLAIRIQQFVEDARTECRLASTVGKMPGISLEHRESGVVAENTAGFEDIHDGACGGLLQFIHDAIPGFWPSPGGSGKIISAICPSGLVNVNVWTPFVANHA